MQRPRVLVVEDNRAQREALVELLQAEGFDTRAAQSVQGGLAEMRRSACEVLILDWELPDGDAKDIFSALDHPASRLVIVSAHDRVGPVPRGATLLRKPIVLDRLWSTLEEVLQESSSEDLS